jgi:hypothetical protein
MTDKPTNPFAFPVPIAFQDGGMSLRDWFAGLALAGVLANPTKKGRWTDYAEVSYVLADAMLAQREKNDAIRVVGTSEDDG